MGQWDFHGISWDFMEISPTIMVVQWEWGYNGILMGYIG